MATKIINVGVDVDDKAFHIAGYDAKIGRYYDFVSKPNFGSLMNKIENLTARGYEVRVCYEATYIGYSLQRNLLKKGIHCDIIAPSLIPTLPGKSIKTDRLDSRKLAEYYSANLLTPITIPNEEDEWIRSLIRTRDFLVQKRSDLKRHILSTCRYYNISYKAEQSGANHWTKRHLQWLNSKINTLEDMVKFNFESLLSNLIQSDLQIQKYDNKIEDIAMFDRYAEKCNALITLKGIQVLTALRLVIEIGDIKRFKNPKKLVSYAGMDIIEYSSGGKEQKYGITKQGNKHIRTSVVEASQSIGIGTAVGKALRLRRDKLNPEIVEIAVRCQQRLAKKKRNMDIKGKQRNIIKVACAREMLGFIWEILLKVA